ncbi:MAG: acetyl-CoA carboxylase carboxyltransferase subunit alpha, partial [Chloroflexia bacterium]|nr:acetyl-CoA carboxylase carboxyltransferase subunit alpha [Chloroflexia bacterium]
MTDLGLEATPGRAPDTTSNGTASHLAAWEQVQLARHRDRPRTLDYLDALTSDFVELHGDRTFGDDRALIGGLARFGERTVMVLGHQKGRDTKENLARNFGMARPEGYRKANRLLRQAGKFGMPVVTLIDTPGAEPGIGSEERGQATAIAESILTMSDLKVPIVAVVISEGGSGGALAIGVADRVLMLEHAIYSVISPEGAAAILWKDASKAPEAAATMRITAADLLRFEIIDE